MGIGRPNGDQDPADFVLKNFSSTEKKELPDLISRGAEVVEYLVSNGLEKTQAKFNS
jgi:PTH1 family peptidyl-tRNA hydrolase